MVGGLLLVPVVVEGVREVGGETWSLNSCESTAKKWSRSSSESAAAVDVDEGGLEARR